MCDQCGYPDHFAEPRRRRTTLFLSLPLEERRGIEQRLVDQIARQVWWWGVGEGVERTPERLKSVPNEHEIALAYHTDPVFHAKVQAMFNVVLDVLYEERSR